MTLKQHFFVISILFFCKSFSQKHESIKLTKVPLKTHFDPMDYNAGIQNWSFDQDSNGILYIANNDGILEFDGKDWNQLSVPLSTKIRAVKVDNQNRIFIGGQNQIGYFSNGVNGMVYTSLNDKLKDSNKIISEIWKIIEIDEKIIFNTGNTSLVYENNELKVLEVPGYVLNAFKNNNTLLVHIYDRGLYKYLAGKFLSVKGTKGLPDLVAVIDSHKDSYYFSRFGEIYRYDNLNKIHKDHSKDFGTVNTVIKLQNGNFAVGTQNKGLFILDINFNIKHHYTKNNGLSDTTVKAIYEDNFNNIWVALNNGIDYLKTSLPFALINEEVGVLGTGYASHKFKNRIYLGSSNGIFTQNFDLKSSSNTNYDFIAESEGQVYNFSQIRNSLFLNSHNGTYEIKNLQLEKFHDMGSWRLIETKIPNLILGGDYQGICYFKKENNRWQKVGRIQNLNESSRIFTFQNDSTLWMTHGYKGAFRMLLDKKMQPKGEAMHFGKDNGFPSDILISVYDLNGKLVFTSEKGVFDFNLDSLKFTPNILFDEILGKDHISALKASQKNTIYYIQNREFGILKEENYGKFKKETAVFKHINKFINDDLPNISIIDNKNILIGAKEGFIHYDQSIKHIKNSSFSTLIRGVEVTDVKDSTQFLNPLFTKDLKLNSEQTIKIKYASVYFDGFEDLTYSYKLSPLDENWSKWASENQKDYDHLPYGNYTFEVKARNIYGVESKTSKTNFRVQAPWYATKTAKFGYVTVGLLAFVLIPLIQSKRYTSVAEEIEKELKIKDEEIDKLNSEKLQTELNLKNEQLTSITMQLLKNKEFILNIQDKIEGTLEKGNSKQQLLRLIKTIDQEVSKNDNWDEFAYHFDQVHGNYLEYLSSNNIRLSPREIKMAAFLRMNMSSKEISKLLNITTRGVELARYRLRKKLNLKRDQNLVEFLIALDKS
tara:strand:- start:10261 stop:13074 length:2814 start_codon:yes stop_codon:yes gene_type:complete